MQSQAPVRFSTVCPTSLLTLWRQSGLQQGGGLGLVKPGTLKLEDTNVALIGSDMDKKLRQHAAATEAVRGLRLRIIICSLISCIRRHSSLTSALMQAWANAGKAVGIEIWRIEQFKVVAVPREQYGTFYDGDSYIVLSTYKVADSPALKYDLHFWLGKVRAYPLIGQTVRLSASAEHHSGRGRHCCLQDRCVSVRLRLARLTHILVSVELDDHLGCTPVEHRQVQGYEDDLFLSYFNPIRILEGGVPTGFKHYTAPDWPKKLFWVQGASAKNIRVSELPIDVANLNSGDVFVLDLGMELHQFNGRQVRPALSPSAVRSRCSLAGFVLREAEGRRDVPSVCVGAQRPPQVPHR